MYPQTMAASERIAARVALVGMGTSAALAAVKIAVGLAAHSVAVVSDGLESAADFFTSGLVWLGLWVAAKPADRDHPYGHGRFEILTGLAMGMLLVAVGAGICLRSMEQRYDKHAPALFAVWPLVGIDRGEGGLMAALKMRVGTPHRQRRADRRRVARSGGSIFGLRGAGRRCCCRFCFPDCTRPIITADSPSG